MRTFLMSAAAVLAVATPAAAQTSGAVGLSWTNNEYDAGGDYDQLQIEGHVTHNIVGPWAVQADARYEEVDYTGSDDDGQHIALHGLYSGEMFTIGALIGQGELFDGDDLDFYGAEGAFDVASFRFTGSAVFGDFGADYDRYRAGVKYFFGDNFAVGGGYAATDYGTVDWDTFDLSAEFRLGSIPLTFTGGYLSQDGDFIDVDALTIGARWDFGTGTLREADRRAPIADLEGFFGDIRRWD